MALPIGELFMHGFRGATPPRWIKDFAREYGLGGVILFDYDCIDRKYERNIANPAQVRDLCKEIHALPSNPLVYVDQEGGKVRRLKEKYGFAPLVSAQNFPTLSETEKRSMLQTSFVQMRELGVDVNLAPVVDLNINPANPDLGAVERCFSADPKIVLESARLYQAAADSAGIGLCLKHFPGCGAAVVNAHLDLMDLSDVMSETQTELFHTLLPSIPMVLLSHGLVRQWDEKFPVSLSPEAVRRVRAWNPDAMVLTDDLQMEGLQKRMTTAEACVQAVRAGIDLICIGHNMRDEQDQCASFAEAVIAACEKDRAMAENVQNSLRRLKTRKSRHQN